MKSLIENALKFGDETPIDFNEFGIAKILVVGAGGAGGNTVTRLHEIGINGAETFVVNTDKQALDMSKATACSKCPPISG